MKKSTHNIICLEAEWNYNSHEKENQFSLDTKPLLNWLKEFYSCDVVYRHILTREDLCHYIAYFKDHPREFKKYDIIYIACHGWNHSICLEGKDGYIDLTDLAKIADGFFTDKIIHFGSCKTLANKDAVIDFKNQSKARLVSGYQTSVDAMKSAIADVAYFNDLMNLKKNIGIITNEKVSKFRRIYKTLLDELGFVAI
jgi:hypothetical protein